MIVSNEVKLTKDCYVNVEGWTEEEVKKAAEIFSWWTGAGIGNIKCFSEHCYLFIRNNSKGDVFVGREYRLVDNDAVRELTKEQVFAADPFNRDDETEQDSLQSQLDELKERCEVLEKNLNNAMDTIAEQDFYIESLEQVIAIRFMNDWN